VLDAEGICDLIADATSRAAPGTGDAVAEPGRRAGR